MPAIDILGRPIPIDFIVGEGATAAGLDEPALLAGAHEMAALINSKAWPQNYRDAFRGMTKIVFFAGKVEVDGFLMDRPCCDQDEATFYWEAEEFMRNTDADVRANTFFHDCWHVVQFKEAGSEYARTQTEQVLREVDAIEHQIEVAEILGCDRDEIGHLKEFKNDQNLIIARLDEGVDQIAPHSPGAMRNI